ncbi:MAG TPA: Mur ligase domain-containing protein [Methylomirabilota bacterium]|jgi:UDP-N-acetylmuramate--alanine ligase|nr:Mur ligase domain-containing protein [Methylomirabilota bacterium]
MRYHFSGIAGAGMNPLARLLAARGHAVQGSDRSFDGGKNAELAARLRGLGITLLSHDGSGVAASVERFVYSTAVESDAPEMRRARDLGVEMVPRPALLAEIVNAGVPGVAIAGTSGKSTITGMAAWLLRESGVTATVIGGAALVGEGTTGGFVPGPAGGPVVAEACESDGTLVGYRPSIGLVHNISRDHGELDWLRPQFTTFAAQCGRLFVNVACPEARALGRAAGATTYGVAHDAAAPLEIIAVGPDRARGRLRARGRDVALEVPQPGRHNLENGAAAALIALELGCSAAAVEALLPLFPGVSRRFEVIGVTATGIRVVDDFAHNGEKIRAALTTAQAGAERVVAVFQPHGFGPARFLRSELKALLPRLLRARDRFCYAEVFYAGGTVARDVTSAMLAADLGPECGYAADHEAVRRWVVSETRPGDTVLLMGARDPDLPRLARAVFQTLQGTAAKNA